jgi:LysR family transcriptional regulator, glycine cleavage system transcriptional activator
VRALRTGASRYYPLMAIAKRSRTRSRLPPHRGLRRLPLSSLRVFVAAAERLSFSRAAQELGVTAAAVSMQIRALEEYLRMPLFVRHGHAMQLTAEGVRLLPRLRDALVELERAIDEARRDRQTGALTVSMLGSFLQQWLLPRLSALRRRFPSLDLRLHTSPLLVDFLSSDVQVAIRFGTGNWPKLHVQKILDDWMVPVCTRQLLERHGPVTDAADLRRYQLLHSDTEPWRAWLDNEGSAAAGWVDEHGSTFDDSVAVIRAAQTGQGLALARWSLVSGEVAEGRLIIASKRIVPMEGGYHFVCPASYLSVEKVATFREWLIEEAKAAPRPPLARVARPDARATTTGA